MSRVVLLTGSNAPNREPILLGAAELLTDRLGVKLAASKIYASQAWGFSAEEPFANQALMFETALSPIEVLDVALAVEQQLGRNREQEAKDKMASGERYASRQVDIDVMFYDDMIICSERLIVPHPLLHEREFALEPLCEIMGSYVHPQLGRTIGEIYEELKSRCGDQN